MNSNKNGKLSPKKLIPVFIMAGVLLIFGIYLIFHGSSVPSLLPTKEDSETTTTINTDVDILTYLMQDMHGAWLTEGVDFPSRDNSEKEEIISAIDAFFAALPTFYIDTVFVKAAFDAQDTDFNPVEYIITKAKETSVFCVLSISADYILPYENSLLYDSSLLKSYVAAYKADAFLLDGLDSLEFLLENDSSSIEYILSNQIYDVFEIIKTAAGDTPVGISILPIWADSRENPQGSPTKSDEKSMKYKANTLDWIKNTYIDFVYIKSQLEMANTDIAPAVVANWWNSHLNNLEKHAVWAIDANLDAEDEFILQHELINTLEAFTGISFSSLKYFIENPTATPPYLEKLDGEILDVVNASDLKISKPTATSIETNESTINFSGTADPKYPLLCNNIEIPRSSMGMFSVQLQLVPGKNEFTFTHNGKNLTYSVMYNIDILTNIYPTGSTQAGGGTLIEIAALCHKNATLYAELDGTKIPMIISGENLFGQSAGESDFVTFKGSFSLPNSNSYISLGKLVFHASYNGVYDTMTGGEVAVLPKLNTSNVADYVTNPIDYTSLYEEKSLSLKTAYSNHSLGTALMCEILKENTETTPEESPDDKSHPFYTPLIKGTFDYVTGVATYDGELHYILASGRKIYAKEAKIIANAYVLPPNKLKAKSVSNGKSTELTISTDWLVPISTLLSPQSYYTGYQSRVFNVNQFTAEYLDITFHHTNGASGNFNKISSNVIKSAKWVDIGSDDTVTLRIQLKNAGRFYGYSLNMTENGEFKISIKERGTSLNGKTIMLDPGHGGQDSGAIGVYSTIYESHINLALANKVKARLESMGANVVMTRYSDTYLSLEQRSNAASKQSPDLFISIHNDASTSSINSGTHTFYYNSFSMPLAASIHKNMVAAYQNGIFTPDLAEYSSIDLGIKFYPFAVTRITDCPAVLIECGFVTNAVNCNALLIEENQNAIASAIANGAKEYFQNY